MDADPLNPHRHGAFGPPLELLMLNVPESRSELTARLPEGWNVGRYWSYPGSAGWWLNHEENGISFPVQARPDLHWREADVDPDDLDVCGVEPEELVTACTDALAGRYEGAL